MPHIALGYNLNDFPFPQAWRIKNNAGFPITYKVFYKSTYPDYARVNEVPSDSPGQLDAGKEKLVELEPTTNLAFTLYPSRIEVSSGKRKYRLDRFNARILQHNNKS